MAHTTDIAGAAVIGLRNVFVVGGGEPADFDRLLSQVRAAAWDEGYTRGFYDREKLNGDSRDASEGASENPHYDGF